MPSRSRDPGVQSMRMGMGVDGASAMGVGESPLMWHHFRLPIYRLHQHSCVLHD